MHLECRLMTYHPRTIQYPVTKKEEEDDEAGWGFTVKQLATTIHEDSVVYTVSASSLTTDDGSSHTYMPSAGLLQEVTVRQHMPLSSWIQRACYKKWNGKPGLACVNVRHPPWKTHPVGVVSWTGRSVVK